MSESTAGSSAGNSGKSHPALAYASLVETGPPLLRDSATFALKMAGLLLLLWGGWSVGSEVLWVVASVLRAGPFSMSLGISDFWDRLLVQPFFNAADELLIGFLLIRYGATLAGWTMPRR